MEAPLPSQSNSETHSGKTLDLEASPTVLIIFAANRFTRIWSRYLQLRFKLSVMEWRVMVMLMAEPGATVSRAATVIDIDKGAISRALARLEAKELASADVPEAYRHRRKWSLTPEGNTLHDRVLAIALQRQNRMLKDVSAADEDALVRSLRSILASLSDLEAADASDAGTGAKPKSTPRKSPQRDDI